MEIKTNEEFIKRLEELIIIVNERQEFDRLNGFSYSKNEGVLAESEILTEQEWLDTVQTWLDYAGIIPVYGDIVDIVNAIIYFIRAGIEGKFMPNGLNGLITIVAAIPVVGSAISIPLKAIFKRIPTKQAARLIETLINKSGDEAADLLYRLAPGDTLNNLGNAINRNRSLVKSFFDGLMSSLKKVPLLGTALRFLEPVVKRLTDFLFGIGDRVAKGTAGKGVLKLGIPSVPKNLLTNSGRLDFVGKNPLVTAIQRKTGLDITSASSGMKRTWFATQDGFMDYLKREGAGKLAKEQQNAIFKQTLKNLDGAPMKVGETIADYAKRTGLPEDRIYREFTNLTLLNKSKFFTDYLNSTSSQKRLETFMKANFPKIQPNSAEWWKMMSEATTVWTVGVKTVAAKTKQSTKPGQEEYSQERETNRQQDKINKSDKEKSGSHYGQQRDL
jgi:hypothetical protein